MLESGPFRFRKPLLRDVCDVFRQSSGIFLIHCEVVHAEDFELEDRLTESVPHYIVYNAGTRVLFLYPEVLVIKGAEDSGVGSFNLGGVDVASEEEDTNGSVEDALAYTDPTPN